MIGNLLKHRYQIEEKVGEGSLFTVYKCEDKIGNKTVAAKVLLPQYSSNRMFAERILVEAESMIGISHPGIVEVFDCGEQDGIYYVIVEYVRGVDFKERIRRNAPFTLSTVVDVGMAICEIMDFAHKKGFSHGDLRPGNILVTPEGQIKISDFWVTNAVNSTPSLRTNALMSSIHYMSPEMTEGGTPTPAADIYSIGIILYETLTASVPFDGDTPNSIAIKHARENAPSVRSKNPAVPKNFDAVIIRALQKSPQERFRSAKSLHYELKSLRESLNFEKPIVWSEPEKKEVAKPLPAEDIEPDETEEVEPVFLKALKKTMLIIVGLISLLLVILVILAVTRPPDVMIPNLLGKTLTEAETMAQEHNFHVAVRSEQFNEDAPEGTIYYMNPAAGRTIKAGKAVDVWISKGSRYTHVPNLVSLTLEQAKRQILNAGLNVGEVSAEHSNEIPSGAIISQNPPSGSRIERRQAVNIEYSLGERPSHTPLYPEEQPEQYEEMRSFDVEMKIPEGPENQKIQIVVEDGRGTRPVHSEVAQPGDDFKHTVEGYGNRITVRIFIDGKLVTEERKWR